MNLDPVMENPDLSLDETNRLEKTVSVIPGDVSTALEIGFYDFRLSKLLAEKFDLVSIDLPRPVMSSNYKLAFADIQRLPFKNDTFDITICTEVLEHLPGAVLQNGVNELKRVSRKYVLVSVPYKQRIWNEMFKCANCGFVCNSMGHVNYMDENRLTSLFGNTSVEGIELVGTIENYAPDLLYSCANRIGQSWCDFSFGNCPNCQQSSNAVKPNLAGYVLRRLIWRAESIAGIRPAWIIALFKLPFA